MGKSNSFFDEKGSQRFIKIFNLCQKITINSQEVHKREKPFSAVNELLRKI